MNHRKIAFAIFAIVAANTSAHASLTGNDLHAAEQYFLQYPDMPAEKKAMILAAKDLGQANDELKGNTYQTGPYNSITVTLPPIPTYTPEASTNPTKQETIPASLLTQATKPVVEPTVTHTPEIATEDVGDIITLPPVDLSKIIAAQTPMPHKPEIATEDLGDVINLPPVDLSKIIAAQTPMPHTPEIATEDVSDIINLPPVDLSKLLTAKNTDSVPMTNINPPQTKPNSDTNLTPIAPPKSHGNAVDEAAITANKSNIIKNKNDIASVETQVDSNTHAVKDDEKTLQQHGVEISGLAKGVIHAEATGEHAQTRADEAFTTAQKAETTGEYAQSRADTAFAHAEANKQALAATNHRLATDDAELANHEQRIGTLESQTTSNFAKLKSQVDDNRKRASAGISGVAAMANIPQVTNTQDFSVGAGVGTADSESALAVGFSARATDNVVVKASVSDDSQHNFVAGAGVSYGW